MSGRSATRSRLVHAHQAAIAVRPPIELNIAFMSASYAYRAGRARGSAAIRFTSCRFGTLTVIWLTLLATGRQPYLGAARPRPTAPASEPMAE